MVSTADCKKRKHTTLTMSDKWDIIERYRRGETPTSLSKVYGIGRSTIYDVVQNQSKIESFMKSVVHEPGDRKTLKTGDNPQVEEALYMWFYQQRKRHTPINGELLKEKCKIFYEEITKNKKKGFRASDGWLNRFKKRHSIRFLQMSGEKSLSDESEVSNFISSLENKIKDQELTPDQVYNAEETGLNWRQLPCKTFATEGEAVAQGRKGPKERLTLMPCTNASGEHKLKLLVVGKFKNPRPFNNMNVEALPVTYKNQPRAWVSRDVFRQWYFDDFVPSVKDFLTRKKLALKALLLLDNAPGHPDDEKELMVETKDGFIEVMFLPKNTTSLIQPLDQNIIKMMKAHYKKRILMDIANIPGSDITTILKKFNIKDAVLNVAHAWDQISSSTIVKSWKNVWPANITLTKSGEDGQQDVLTLQEDLAAIENEAEHLLTLFSLTRCEINQEDISLVYLRTWMLEEELDADLADREIVEEVKGINEQEEDNSFQESVAASTSFRVSCDEAVTAVNTLLQWAEERGADCEEILVLKKMQEKAVTDIFKGLERH